MQPGIKRIDLMAPNHTGGTIGVYSAPRRIFPVIYAVPQVLGEQLQALVNLI